MIYDSNRPSLLSLYHGFVGSERVVDVGIVKDKDGIEGLTRHIQRALAR